jgi:two-component system, OmpR family, phosphate regulon sensor histidine kinase PhoR
MKPGNNRITLVLMSSSIMLLVILQLAWLKNSYEQEFESLKKETNTLFRATIIQLQDSMIVSRIQPVLSGDSARIQVRKESNRIEIFNAKIIRDSINRKPDDDPASSKTFHYRDSVTQVQITVNSPYKGDSIRKVIRPIITEVQRNPMPGNFIIRMGDDSLRRETIQKKYTDTLRQSGLPFVPLVKRTEPGTWTETTTDAFSTEPFFMPRTTAFIAGFGNVKPYLLKQISPQLIFSLVLTALTITAFVLMYRSILSQQKLMQLKNDLISNITHELKTPVATVSVALEALQSFQALNDPERTKEYLAMAQHELNRLNLMTDKVLKSALFENNALVLDKEPVDLKRTVQQVVDSMKLVFGKHQATVSIQTTGDNFQLHGSLTHLTNVVYNLLENALKYTQQLPVISVSLQDQEQFVSLSIQDNGIGIPEEYQHKIFDKFFRVPSGDVHNTKGYGLGLSYVASVVRSHGGTIQVHSEPGKGSTFTMLLPR